MSKEKNKFDVQKTANSIRFIFASTFRNIDEVCDRTRQFLQSNVEDIDKELFSINLVIREGLTNAVRHGNAGDYRKTVNFLLKVEDHRIIKLVIQDQGDGFDWKKQQIASTCDDADHGRGILIMETYFNGYAYNEKGNILYLEKDLST